MNCIQCDNIVENKDTGLCATCSAKKRKINKLFKRKISEKTKQKAIAKVSIKQSTRLAEYNKEVKKWIVNKACQVCGLKANQCHHSRGRLGINLLDKSTWIPVCAKCHERIHRESKWAQENVNVKPRSI